MRLSISRLLTLILESLAIRAAGNRFMQGLLAKKVQAGQYLMGIGAGAHVAFSGERAIFQLLRQRARPPYCIFDVGANKGQFLRLALAEVATGDCSIHCFEPGRETFKDLVASSREDGRVKLNNVALGKEKGEAVLYYDRAGSGLASLTRRNLDHYGIAFAESENVHIDTIDSYCAQKAIGRIDLLKIDIEGHELDALAGASRMLGTKSIDLVSFEFGGCNIDTRTFFRDFWQLFSGLDFAILRITPSGYLHPITAYQELHEQFLPTNFVAVANGR